jgi:hypothetical protein
MWTSLVLNAKNFIEVTRSLPKHGIGAKLRRTTWGEDSFWQVTAVKPHEDGVHGKASGILTWKGVQQSEKPRRVNGVLKKIWILADDSANPELKTWQTVPKPAVAAEASSPKDAASEAQ